MSNQVAEVSPKYLAEATSNAIPVGYKQTEVGVIPEDWEVLHLDRLVVALESGVSVNSLDSLDGFPHGCHVLKTSCVSNGYFFASEAKSILPRDMKRAKCLARKGSIIVSRMNTPALVGELGFVPADVPNLFLPDRLWQMRLSQEKGTDAKWLAFLLSYPVYAQKIKEFATGTSGSMKNISKGSFLALHIPYPSTKEQTAIANALSDVDALIQELEKLIAKKQAIKAATMQQLLSGRTRLPPFALREDGTKKGTKPSELGEIPEDWGVVTLGQSANCLDNLRIPLNEQQRSKMRGDIPYCGANGVVGWVNDYVLDDDVILMAEDGGYFDEFATRPIAYRMVGKCWVNNHAHILQAKEGFDQAYIFYCLVHKDIQKYLASGTRAKLNKSEMERIEVITPSSKQEQTAIATILSDMDEEIQALEQRLSKTRQIKQGMMQELLTGKTRLIQRSEAV